MDYITKKIKSLKKTLEERFVLFTGIMVKYMYNEEYFNNYYRLNIMIAEVLSIIKESKKNH
jgi:hypothetical protein